MRRVDTSGIITTFAGTGTEGKSGDGGPATQARLSFPLSVTGDADGNIFIGEYGGIRKADSGRYNHRHCRRGQEVPAPLEPGKPRPGLERGPGSLSISRGIWLSCLIAWCIGLTKTGRSRQLPAHGLRGFFGNDGGPAVLPSFWETKGVAIDPWGNLYVANQFNHRVRHLNMPSRLFTKLEGEKAAFFRRGGNGSHPVCFRPAPARPSIWIRGWSSTNSAMIRTASL